ncbi:MAG: alpha-1,2-fucosyltransferase [Cyanobacterium sp. T60_A2020_053]|nr:alpha-1,2-fucosyltransferase [Cyanobacterium sp. T60_A2020_053]
MVNNDNISFGKTQKYSLTSLFYLASKYVKSSPFHHTVDLGKSQNPFDMNGCDFQNLIKSKQFVIVHGWLFRDAINFSTYAPLIRQIFTPTQSYRENVKNLIERMRCEVDIIVGIHLRRGDYRKWANGQYYYSDDIYLKKMSEISNSLLNTTKKVGFLLVSNEEININNFKDYNVALGTGNFIEDLYSLAKCDYILGPPSSYSIWASFYGENPYFHLRDVSEIISLEKFKKYIYPTP